MRLPGKALGAFIAFVAIAAVTAAPANAQFPSLFGTVAYRGAYLSGWPRVVERLRADAEAFAGCAATPGACPSRLVAAWVAELDVLRERAPMSRLAAVNRLVNMTPYRRDSATYGVRDHWASPGEFLVNGGDCEDIALFKFFLLRRLGFADDRLRIVFVREDTPWVSHAVLAVHLDGEVYILDNLTDSVLPQGRVAGYAPLYSANETTRWAHFAPPRLIASPDHS